MATITTRSGKGSPLTNNEVDANFNNLNTDKLELSGGTLTGNLSLGDGVSANFGAGSDLQIYHDGSHSYVSDTGTGYLRLKGSNYVQIFDASDAVMANFESGGSVYLAHNGADRFATTSTGIDVTGTATMDGLTVDTGANSFNALEIKASSATGGTYGLGIGSGSDFTIYANGTSNNLIKATALGDISFYEDTGTTPKFFWDASAESLGIGTSSPVTALEISTDGADHITLNRADASININNVLGGIVVSADDPTANRSGAKIGFTAGANWTTNNFPTNIIFSNDASGTMTERMRIDSSGNLLVGNTDSTPYDRTSGNAIALGDGLISSAQSGGNAAIFNRMTNDGSIVGFRKDGTSVGSIGTANGDLHIDGGASHSGIRFQAGSLLPRLNGSDTDGTIDLGYDDGSAIHRFKDLHLSGTANVGSLSLGDNQYIFLGGGNDGRIHFDGTDTLNITASNGSATTLNVTANNFKIGGASRLISGAVNDSVVINEDSGDVDFRVESNGNANMLFVDGGNNRVGVNTGSPAATFTVKGTANTYAGGFQVEGADETSAFAIAHIDGSTFISGNATNDHLKIAEDGSLSTPTLGTSNVRFGVNAGNSIVSGGSYNVVVGDQAGTAITTGDNNIAVGFAALDAEDTGSNNVAIGASALSTLNYNGSGYNTAVGSNAGAAVTTGTSNTLIGGLAGDATTTGSNNTAVGAQSLGANTTGGSNVAVGLASLAANTTASENTALGYASLSANTTGAGNTATGFFASSANTTGANNVANGYKALLSNTTASNNTAQGYFALSANTTGANNTAIGALALDANTTGAENVAVGYGSLGSNTTAEHNVAVGREALTTNTTGASNVALGRNALYANTTASNNTAVGYVALAANTTGTGNSAVGASAGSALTTGSNNTALGQLALDGTNDGAGNTAIGKQALSENCGDNNTAVGYLAGLNTTASNNTAVGYSALVANTTGTNNVAIGKDALDSNTTGSNNTALGVDTLQANTTASDSTALGHGALAVSTGSANTAVGKYALVANSSASNNTAVGTSALAANTTGFNNVSVGQGALLSNTTANYNTAVGVEALRQNTTGASNSAYGLYSLLTNTTGSSNVAVGQSALYANTTASNNTAVGINAGAEITTGATNTLIGKDSGRFITTGANNTILGPYHGNQGGLDIRTSSNNIVLSDGVGNPRAYFVDSTSDWLFHEGAFGIGGTSDATIYRTGADGSGLHFSTNSVLPASNAGAVNSNVMALGSAGNRFTDLYLSGGVYLGGTGAANKLDDYEEGTWNPAFVNFNGTSGWGFSNAKYTKIGNLVYLSCDISGGSGTLSSTQNSSRLSGMPFSVNGTYSPCSFSTNYITDEGTGVLYGNVVYTPSFSITNEKVIYFSGVYQTA